VSFFRRHRLALIALLVAIAVFLALYWIASSTGPGTFEYEIR
jgi:hypothetical protein